MRHTINLKTMLGLYFECNKSMKSITSALMNTAVRQVGQKLGLQIQSLHQQNISSQSLRAGEAMAVHLAGTSDNSIKKMGPW